MNRITGVYSPHVYCVNYRRKDGHTFIFRYRYRGTLLRHMGQMIVSGCIEIADAERVAELAMQLEWQTKGV